MDNVKIGNKNNSTHDTYLAEIYFNRLTYTFISDTLCCDMIDCDRDDFYGQDRG